MTAQEIIDGYMSGGWTAPNTEEALKPKEWGQENGRPKEVQEPPTSTVNEPDNDPYLSELKNLTKNIDAQKGNVLEQLMSIKPQKPEYDEKRAKNRAIWAGIGDSLKLLGQAAGAGMGAHSKAFTGQTEMAKAAAKNEAEYDRYRTLMDRFRDQETALTRQNLLAELQRFDALKAEAKDDYWKRLQIAIQEAKTKSELKRQQELLELRKKQTESGISLNEARATAALQNANSAAIRANKAGSTRKGDGTKKTAAEIKAERDALLAEAYKASDFIQNNPQLFDEIRDSYGNGTGEYKRKAGVSEGVIIAEYSKIDW